MRIGLKITDYSGDWKNLSEDLYEITSIEGMMYKDDPKYQVGSRVRLISGVMGSSIPGYHDASGWVTVCSNSAWTAEFLGFEKNI